MDHTFTFEHGDFEVEVTGRRYGSEAEVTDLRARALWSEEAQGTGPWEDADDCFPGREIEHVHDEAIARLHDGLAELDEADRWDRAKDERMERALARREQELSTRAASTQRAGA